MYTSLNYNMPALFCCILSYSFPYRKHIVLIVHCQSASALQTGQLRMFQTGLLPISAPQYGHDTIIFWLFHYLPSCPQDRYIMFPLLFLTCVSSDAADLPYHTPALSVIRAAVVNIFLIHHLFHVPDPQFLRLWQVSDRSSLFILMASLFLNSSA